MLLCEHPAARSLSHQLLELTCYCAADGTKTSVVKNVEGGKPTEAEVKAVQEGQVHWKGGGRELCANPGETTPVTMISSRHSLSTPLSARDERLPAFHCVQ